MPFRLRYLISATSASTKYKIGTTTWNKEGGPCENSKIVKSLSQKIPKLYKSSPKKEKEVFGPSLGLIVPTFVVWLFCSI